MDDLSHTFLNDDQDKLESKETQLALPPQKANLHLGSTHVHNNIHHHVNLHFFGAKLEQHFLQKFDIYPKHHKQIQWMTLERAYRSTAKQDKLSVFNLLHNKWTTNMFQASWNPDKNPDCNRCSDRAENHRHIFSCMSNDACTSYKKAKSALITAMQKANTAPLINTAIITVIDEHMKGYQLTLRKNPFHTQDQHELASEVMTYQRKMGLEFLLRGYLSSQWEVIQNTYLSTKYFNTSATNWSTRIIKSLWKFSISMWKAQNDFVHGRETGKKNSARRKELIKQIEEELMRTSLRQNNYKSIQGSMGNALVPILEVWLRILRNVKGEVFQKKQFTAKNISLKIL